jgi:signal transduction histidine kinase
VLAAVLVGAVCVVAAPLAWLVTGGPYWPRWVWFGVGTGALAVGLARRVFRVSFGPRRWIAADGALLLFLTPVEVSAWLLSGRGTFWPVFSLVGLSIVFGAHIWYVARRPDSRERALADRVDTLTRTRRDVMNIQAAELRRIERDLHDGAQARMVSVALSIGVAQRLLVSDPEKAAKMLADARVAATGAVQDLRGVMNGIYPAVLSDRGLAGAVRALTYDLVIPTQVHGDPPPELGPAPEAALYFAVAECLANAVKHGQASSCSVRFRVEGADLVIEVTDDGCGGASLASGTGLRGVVDRLAAFDGRLDLDSPPGGPTLAAIRMPLAVATARSQRP